MVVINSIKNMFWGVTVDSGKRYSQVVKQTFHLSMAALEPGSGTSNEFVQVMVQHGSSEFLLCSLQQGKLLQQPLDLLFATGEELAFSLTGKGVVHLTGYLLEDQDDEDDFDYDSEDEESDAPQLVEVDADALKAGTKRKAIESSLQAKKTKLADIDFGDEDDSEDDDYNDDDDEDDDDDDDDEDDDEEFSEDDLTFDEDEDSEIEEDKEEPSPAVKAVKTPVVTPKAGTVGSAKKDKQGKGKANDKSPQSTPKSTPAKLTPGKESAKTPKSGGEGKQKQQEKAPETPSTPANGESAKKKKKKKKKNKDGESMNQSTSSSPEKSSGESTPKSASKKDGKQEAKKDGTPKLETLGKRRVVAGGTVVEDTKVGHGPEAKAGKMVSVYYVGTLSKNNKQFDSCTSGKPFRFRLKQGEVIKGWDNGVEGMKVGGKRKITVPANQAYGNKSQGPIPANSALSFEVELKAVS